MEPMVCSVPSGEFRVDTHRAEILEACLGTCVGVAVYDREAGVGGLIHLLLAEPPGRGDTPRPHCYASLGLPVFLSELRKEGAEPERMKACVAGGALVGPVTRWDLQMDVGGKTVEVVTKILDREKIEVEKSETGGFLASSLRLDLSSGHTEIRPVGAPSNGTGGPEFHLPLDEEQVEKTIRSIRPIPQVVTKAIRMIRESRCSALDVARELEQDQVLAGRVLGLCNAAYHSRGRRVGSVARAVSLLGLRTVLESILLAYLEEFYGCREGGYSLCKGGLYAHALATAGSARRIAELSGAASPESAFLAGLLHDVGKVGLDQYVARSRPLFYRSTQIHGEEMIETEKKVFGLTHPQLGLRLAREWSLPEDLIEVVAEHHQPDPRGRSSGLTYAVYLADLLISHFLPGKEMERMNADHAEPALRALGFGRLDFPSLAAFLPALFKNGNGGTAGANRAFTHHKTLR